MTESKSVVERAATEVTPYTPEQVAAMMHARYPGDRWVATVVARDAEIARLREALVKIEPWAHTLNGPTSLTPMARQDGTTGGIGIASMTPFAAKSSSLKHDEECPGCAARAALSTTQPAQEGK
jgi:hypothetical protein